jgi:hypothetical protein
VSTTSSAPATADDDLDVAHVDTGQWGTLFDGEGVEGDVGDGAGVVVDEMVVGFEAGVEDDAVAGDGELAQQALRHEQVQRVVDGGARQGRGLGSDPGEDLVGGGWLSVVRT